MDEPTIRAWSKPELIVLVRGGPEEAVLRACKGAMVFMSIDLASLRAVSVRGWGGERRVGVTFPRRAAHCAATAAASLLDIGDTLRPCVVAGRRPTAPCRLS